MTKLERKAFITTIEAIFWLGIVLLWGFVSELPTSNRFIASLVYSFPAYMYGKKARKFWVKAQQQKRLSSLRGTDE